MSEKQKLGQEAAFASSYDAFVGHDSLGNREYVRENNIGMSKRFYAACAAMQGLLANPDIIRPYKDSESAHIQFADVCFQYADALLRQEYP